LLNRVIWLIRNTVLEDGLEGVISHYREGIERLERDFDRLVAPAARKAAAARAASFAQAGVPEALARKIARLPLLASAMDVTLIADRTQKPVEAAAATYFATHEFFQLDGLLAAAGTIEAQDRFERLAIDRAVDSIGANERRIAADILAGGKSGEAAVRAWSETRKAEIAHIRSRLQEIGASGFTLAKLIVAAGLMRDLVKD
jgi:glutamate dehydrogenase